MGMVSLGVCVIIMLSYCHLMKKQHGEFSITAVSYINNSVTAINSQAYQYASNQEIVDFINSTEGDKTDGNISWNVFNLLNEKYSVDELKEFGTSSLKNDPKFVKFLISKTLQLGTLNIGTSGYVVNNEEYSKIDYNCIGNLVLPINFAFVYLLMIISIIYLLVRLLKYKEIDWITAILTILILANLFTLIVGAPFESQRLFLSSIVSVLLLIARLLTIKFDKIKQKEIGVSEIKMSSKLKNILYNLFIKKTNDTKIQFLRYLFVGGFAAVVNIGSLFVFKEFFHFHYLLANILGFLLGLITNYILSKWLVFAKENNLNNMIEFIIYTIIGVIGLGLDTLFMWIFTDTFKVFYMLSKIISTGLVFIWNFFGRKGIYIITDKIRKGE